MRRGVFDILVQCLLKYWKGLELAPGAIAARRTEDGVMIYAEYELLEDLNVSWSDAESCGECFGLASERNGVNLRASVSRASHFRTWLLPYLPTDAECLRTGSRLVKNALLVHILLSTPPWVKATMAALFAHGAHSARRFVPQP